MDLKLGEAGSRVGVSTAYLRRLILEGKIRATRNPDPKGPYWTITEAECERIIAARRAKGKGLEVQPISGVA